MDRLQLAAWLQRCYEHYGNSLTTVIRDLENQHSFASKCVTCVGDRKCEICDGPLSPAGNCFSCLELQ